eukprot:CAMPEP_0114516962 /NCGR_PEP_ID=MMETSP0109-20121206/17627_1 /TAXON_ID=29199 /ORGANISM="Chlorarachnion reptans, Strain CCCM449" /LENGTH=60 /DNA_ID=CAMNT_0001697425 /DNA_START=1 /DNA_END=180 /DNA_ORIENTATION=-
MHYTVTRSVFFYAMRPPRKLKLYKRALNRQKQLYPLFAKQDPSEGGYPHVGWDGNNDGYD